MIGPDEYHENIDDNAFTNVMARWNIERGLELAGLMRESWPERLSGLSDRLYLRAKELEREGCITPYPTAPYERWDTIQMATLCLPTPKLITPS